MAIKFKLKTFDDEDFRVFHNMNELQYTKTTDGLPIIKGNRMLWERDEDGRKICITSNNIQEAYFERVLGEVNIFGGNIDVFEAKHVFDHLNITNNDLKTLKVGENRGQRNRDPHVGVYLTGNPNIEELILPPKLIFLYIDVSVYYRFKDYIDSLKFAPNYSTKGIQVVY